MECNIYKLQSIETVDQYERLRAETNFVGDQRCLKGRGS
jgi:hypothetical protein